MFRKRWVRRLANTLIALVIPVVGGGFYARHKSQQRGLERVTAVTARLDADAPRWRLDENDADRGFLPDEQNSALLIPKFKAVFGGRDVNAVRLDKSQIF